STPAPRRGRCPPAAAATRARCPGPAGTAGPAPPASRSAAARPSEPRPARRSARPAAGGPARRPRTAPPGPLPAPAQGRPQPGPADRPGRPVTCGRRSSGSGPCGEFGEHVVQGAVAGLADDPPGDAVVLVEHERAGDGGRRHGATEVERDLVGRIVEARVADAEILHESVGGRRLVPDINPDELDLLRLVLL